MVASKEREGSGEAVLLVDPLCVGGTPEPDERAVASPVTVKTPLPIAVAVGMVTVG